MVLSVSVAVGRAALFAPICGSSGILQVVSGFSDSTISYQLSTTLLALLCTCLHYFAVILNHHESRFTFHATWSYLTKTDEI